jgi:hypothetical protein
MSPLFWLVLVIGVGLFYGLWQIHDVLVYISRQLRDWELPVLKSIYARNDPKDPHNSK